ncbi:transketolase family protein [Candidatus Saccharibacteria bacterium]|nr:transketolase family protein [Candidatus Saccharibacteria bacterium]
MQFYLRDNILNDDVEKEPIRAGFGRGLKAAGDKDENIVALCADLTESTQMHLFKNAHPNRFIETGIAEQNLVTVAAGLARTGKIPFTSSYAAFSPGRNWEQIRTTACLNEMPVKIIGSHAGISVGPDGATHQMLEDIALMRVLPHMVVIAPGDSIEAEKATQAIAENNSPSYLRLARDKTPIFSTEKSPFEIGKAYVLRKGHDVALFGTGAMTYELLRAAQILADNFAIEAEVVHVPTIKPLDTETLLESARRCGRVVTAEEAQIAGGFGSAVAELLSEQLPMPLKRLGMNDRFGESGQPAQLMDHFGLTGEKMAKQIVQFVQNSYQYHQ